VKSIEVTGKTEEEAIESGLRELGLTRDDVSVEVVERAKAGFLGIGSTPAVVRLVFAGEESRAGTPEETTKTSAGTPEETAKTSAGTPEDTQAGARAETLDAFLAGLFEHMGVRAAVSVSETDTDINVELTCEEQGVLVGKNGEVLSAIAHVASYVVNRENRGRPRTRINVDAENFRRRRDEELTALARDTASKVIKLRHNIRLDPMNAYERHVVHEALQDNDKVSTYSVGDEPRRRVVVYYGRREGS
jgi:spoIIIJ-associated protein